MNALFSVLGVMGSNLDQSQGMNPENDMSTKSGIRRNSVIYSQLLTLRKDVFVPYLSLQFIKLPDDALVDPWELEAQTWSKRKV